MKRLIMIRMRSQRWIYAQQWNECNANIEQIQIIVIIKWLCNGKFLTLRRTTFYLIFLFRFKIWNFGATITIIVIHLIDCNKKNRYACIIMQWTGEMDPTSTSIFNGIFLSLTIETMFGINSHAMVGSKTFSNVHKTKSNGNWKIKTGSNWITALELNYADKNCEFKFLTIKLLNYSNVQPFNYNRWPSMVTIILSLNISDTLWITNFYSHVFTWMADIWHFIRPSHPILLNGEQFVMYAKWINLYIKYICSSETVRRKNITNTAKSWKRTSIVKKRRKNIEIQTWYLYVEGTFIFYLWTEMTEKEKIPIETKKKKKLIFLIKSIAFFFFFLMTRTLKGEFIRLMLRYEWSDKLKLNPQWTI